MSTTYEVVLALSTTGNLNASVGELGVKAGTAHAQVAKIGDAAKTMGSAVESMGSRLGGVLSSIADKVQDTVVGFAKMGAAAGLAGAVYGVYHLNNQLEQTQISLAAIFQAQGFASTFTGGMTQAADQVAKMKNDVKTLPGDLGQLSNIMKTIATPAAQAGAGTDAIRQLAGNTMLIGQILGVPQEVAAREMAQLLSGRAGAHNILGTRLGFVGEDAKRLNAESAADRYKDINAQLAKYGGAKDAFGQTFVAQWTTAIDNVKYKLATPMTSSLFDHVKASLGEVNAWFDKNADKVENFALTVGGHLANAWDRAEAAVRRFEPTLERVANIAEHFGTKNAVDMAERAIPAALALKLAPGVVGGGARLLGSAIEAGGGEAAAAALPSALSIALPLFLATAGAIDNLTTVNGHFRETTVADFTSIAHHGEEIGKSLLATFEHVRPLIDSWGDMFTKSLDAVAWTAEKTAKALEMTVGPFEAIFKQIERLMPGYKEYAPKGYEFGIDAANYDRTNEILLNAMSNRLLPPEEKAKPRASPSTTIQKVEIIVKGSDDPSRVARLTLTELKKLTAHPSSSPYVPNYASAR